MSLSEKFANLTAEKQQQVREIKDAAGLDAFLASDQIMLDEAERAAALLYFETGKQPLDDEDLDISAGGQDKDKDYKAMAFADGRKEPIGIGMNQPQNQTFCSCFVEEAWARTVKKRTFPVYKGTGTEHTYQDCKCYRCGHQEPTYRISITL